jgi:MFS family permease
MPTTARQQHQLRTKTGIRANIRKIYLYRVLLGLIFPVPTIVLFWQEHGMSLTDVMVLQALFAGTMVLLEVPSGYLSDTIGRRKTLLLAGCANTVAVLIYSQAQHFFHFLLAEMCFACGFAFISGTDAALIYDTLAALDEESDYQKVYGKLYFYNLFAIAAQA